MDELTVYENNEVAPYEYNDYIKPNFLIGAKFRSTLFDNKIMAISLAGIGDAKLDKEVGVLFYSIKAAKLKKLLKGNNSSFYTQLDKAAQRLTGYTMGTSNPETKSFDYMAVITRAYYKKGVFTIEYNPRMVDYIENIKKNFTILNLETMLSFNSTYAFRIYEILKSKAFFPKGVRKKGNTFKATISLSELKLCIGIVDAGVDKVKRILSDKKNPDYDKAVELAPEKYYDDWDDFKRYVLDTAIEEINEMTDMCVTYEPVRSGIGGKTVEIEFIMTLKKDIEDEEEETTEMSEEEYRDHILDEIYEMFNGELKLKDVRAIATVANYNLDKVKKAYDIYENNKDMCENIVGFMIAAIRNNYTKKKSKKINSFLDYEQRQYNFEEIEEFMLANN